MSHAAIAAVLARHDLSTGERLVAWALASFANREHVAWPGIPAAGARAGLSRSRYLEVRDQLVRRGLLEVEKGVGRRQSSIVGLLFAKSGPWWEGEVNVELVEAVLAYSRQHGPARLLLATLAALADGDGIVDGLTTEGLCRASGLANSTYRRARPGCSAQARSRSTTRVAAAAGPVGGAFTIPPRSQPSRGSSCPDGRCRNGAASGP